MIVPDANLLLYAYDSTSPFHAKARRWWSKCLSGTEAVGLTHPVLFAFLRVATSRRVYEQPIPLAEAAGHVRSWLSRNVARVLLPDDSHTGRVIELLEAAGGSGGNLVTDAQVAALAIDYGGEVHTADRDFLRFPGVRCRFPVDA